MNEKELIEARHSVRSYLDKKIAEPTLEILENAISAINRENNLHIQLVTDEPHAFDFFPAHYGKFAGVTNYIALIGPKSKDLEEKLGYFGEKLVLLVQSLGLNSCWVGLTYKKKKANVHIAKGEKLSLVIAIGYGRHRGFQHKSKEISKVTKGDNFPDYFLEGVRYALLAPTAMNQQKFYFTYLGDNTVSSNTKKGPFSKVDLGIAKYHFEIGAGKENFKWAD